MRYGSYKTIRISLPKICIDYIMDADKTDHEILISSHACGHQTAYLEFENTKNSWNSSAKI